MPPKSSKRPSMGLFTSLADDVPRAKRLRSWKKKQSLLMNLPTELRLKILQELLWQHEPLKITRELDSCCDCIGCSAENTHLTRIPRQTTFSFSPAVLRTCRTLHQEGISLLYNNTFACELWYDFDNDVDPYVSTFLRPDWNPTGTHIVASDFKRFYSPRYLLKHVKKLDVVVKVLGDEGCSSTRLGVRKFVQGTKKFGGLSHLTIRLDLPLLPVKTPYADVTRWQYENREITRDDYKDQALTPFATLRKLKHVEVHGAGTEITNELKAIMTSCIPAVDLALMYESLNDYTFACIRYEHCLVCRMTTRYLERAEHAADMEDEIAFKEARSKIFSLIAEHQEQQRLKACQYDVIKPSLTNQAKILRLLPEPAYDTEDLDSEDLDIDDLDTEVAVAINSGKPDGSEWTAQMKLDWERRNDETEEDRLRRKEEEQLRPSLTRLREIVRWERDESPWSRG